jgi:hypothetical protein
MKNAVSPMAAARLPNLQQSSSPHCRRKKPNYKPFSRNMRRPHLAMNFSKTCAALSKLQRVVRLGWVSGTRPAPANSAVDGPGAGCEVLIPKRMLK